MQASYLNFIEARVSSYISKHVDKIFYSLLLLHRCPAYSSWYLALVYGRKKSYYIANDSDYRDYWNSFGCLDIRKSLDFCSRVDCFLGNLFGLWTRSGFRLGSYNVAPHRSDNMWSVDGVLYWLMS